MDEAVGKLYPIDVLRLEFDALINVVDKLGGSNVDVHARAQMALDALEAAGYCFYHKADEPTVLLEQLDPRACADGRTALEQMAELWIFALTCRLPSAIRIIDVWALNCGLTVELNIAVQDRMIEHYRSRLRCDVPRFD